MNSNVVFIIGLLCCCIPTIGIPSYQQESGSEDTIIVGNSTVLKSTDFLGTMFADDVRENPLKITESFNDSVSNDDSGTLVSQYLALEKGFFGDRVISGPLVPYDSKWYSVPQVIAGPSFEVLVAFFPKSGFC